jgi:hypothetical protein
VEDSVRPITALSVCRGIPATGDTAIAAAGLPWRTHYHVFTLQGLFAALNWFNQQGLGGCWLLEAQEESDSNVGNGHTLVLSKQAACRRWSTVSASWALLSGGTLCRCSLAGPAGAVAEFPHS